MIATTNLPERDIKNEIENLSDQENAKNKENYKKIDEKFKTDPETVLKSLKGNLGKSLDEYLSSNKDSAIDMYRSALESEKKENMDRMDKKAIGKIKKIIEEKYGDEETIRKELGKIQLEEDFNTNFNFNKLKEFGEFFQKGNVNDWFKNIPAKYKKGDNIKLDNALDSKYYSVESFVKTLYIKNEERRTNLSSIINKINIQKVFLNKNITNDKRDKTLKELKNPGSEIAKTIISQINKNGGKLANDYWEYQNLISENKDLLKARNDDIGKTILKMETRQSKLLPSNISENKINIDNKKQQEKIVKGKNNTKKSPTKIITEKKIIAKKPKIKNAKEYNKTSPYFQKAKEILSNATSDKGKKLQALLETNPIKFQKIIYDTTQKKSPKLIDGKIGKNSLSQLQKHLSSTQINNKTGNKGNNKNNYVTISSDLNPSNNTQKKQSESANIEAVEDKVESTAKKKIESKSTTIEHSKSIKNLNSIIASGEYKNHGNIRENENNAIIKHKNGKYYMLSSISNKNNYSIPARVWNGEKFTTLEKDDNYENILNTYRILKQKYINHNYNSMKAGELNKKLGYVDGGQTLKVKAINVVLFGNTAWEESNRKFNKFYENEDHLTSILNSKKRNDSKKTTIGAYAISNALKNGLWGNDTAIIKAVLNKNNEEKRDNIAKRYKDMTNGENMWKQIIGSVTRDDVKGTPLANKLQEEKNK